MREGRRRRWGRAMKVCKSRVKGGEECERKQEAAGGKREEREWLMHLAQQTGRPSHCFSFQPVLLKAVRRSEGCTGEKRRGSCQHVSGDLQERSSRQTSESNSAGVFFPGRPQLGCGHCGARWRRRQAHRRRRGDRSKRAGMARGFDFSSISSLFSHLSSPSSHPLIRNEPERTNEKLQMSIANTRTNGCISLLPV
jgi:hypothetical protein